MDYFFTRHSFPTLAIDGDIHFHGNVTDSKGTPHYLELELPKKRDFLSLLIQNSNGEFINFSTPTFDFAALPLKEKPYNPNTRSYRERVNTLFESTRYRNITIISNMLYGDVVIYLDLSKITINFLTPLINH